MTTPHSHDADFVLNPIGRIHSTLTVRHGAPRQGNEGAPDARVEVHPEFLEAVEGVKAGQDIILLTWLHQARRETLKTIPRDEPTNPMTGVFATRSPDRPKSAEDGVKRRAAPSNSSLTERHLSVTVSIGACAPSGRLNTPAQVIRAADEALYRAKQGGRNRVST